MSDKPTFKQRWQTLTTAQRMGVVFGGGAGLVMILVLAVAPSQPPVPAGKKKTEAATKLAMPGTDKDMVVEKLGATIDALVREDKRKSQELENLKKSNNAPRSGAGQADPATVEELRSLRQKINQLEAAKNSEPTLDEALPGAGMNAYPGPNEAGAVQQYSEQGYLAQQRDSGAPGFRVSGSPKDEESELEEQKAAEPTAYIPSGTNFEGVLLNGMDAPTSGVAQKNPVPALIRVKTEAILPNRYKYDVSECFIIVSGYGVMSTERAQLQTVTLSCLKNSGEVIESKMEGYVVGEDGKVGLRGRLVTRQGALLAKTFIAGFASGVGSAMTPVAVQPLNTSPGGTVQYQTPSLDQVVTAGTAQGISQSARNLSQFYLNMANEMFPVIEIDAKRRVTVVLLKGLELKLTGENQS